MDLAVTCFFSITYSTVCFTLSVSYIRNANFRQAAWGMNALCFTESVVDSQVTKYSEYGSPAACTYSPAVKSGTQS